MPFRAMESLFPKGEDRISSAHIGGKGLIDELLQCLRLLLFRDSAHNRLAHDVAVPVYHIGGGIGKDIGLSLIHIF